MALSGSSVAQLKLELKSLIFSNVPFGPQQNSSQPITPSAVSLIGLPTGFSQTQSHRCPACGLILTNTHASDVTNNAFSLYIKSKITANVFHKLK